MIAMKKRLVLLLGLLLLLVQVAPPPNVGAAPAVTVSPGSGPRGTAVGVSATGLTPSTDHLVQLVRGTGNTNTERLFEDTTPSDAKGELHYRVAVTQEPGQYSVRIVAIGGTVLATAPFTVTPGGIPAGERYFPETGHAVKGRFLGYFRAHGLSLADPGVSERESLALFGYPISGEIEQRLEDGRTYTVQYFERARMEFHPEHEGTPHEVLLGQFGRRIVAGVPGAPTAPVADARHGRYFPETGHNVLDGAFLDFWQSNGGLAVFGYPLSEEFMQTLEDGKRYKVQYFERARLEFHPEQAGSPYAVQLGQFGRAILGPAGGPGTPR
jgi:hypothetical protein